MLTDIDVRFAGFDVYDVEPGKIPDLFASRPIVVFGKWRGAIGGSIEISGKTGRGAYQTSIAVMPQSADASHAALRHLWARTRIAESVRFRSGHAERGSHQRDHVTRTDVQPADEVHVVHCRARSRATHQRRRRRCRSAVAAAGGRVRSRRRSDEWSRARTDLGVARSPSRCLDASHLLRARRRLEVARHVARRRPPSGGEDRSLGVLAVVALIAYGLKRHYADAGHRCAVVDPDADRAPRWPGDRRRVRGGPRRRLLLGGTYVSDREGLRRGELHDRGVRDGGVRAVASRPIGARGRAASWVVSLLASYVAAVIVNTVRIVIAMWLAAHPMLVVDADRSRRPSPRRHHRVLRRPGAALRGGAARRSRRIPKPGAATGVLLRRHARRAARERCGARRLFLARAGRAARPARPDRARLRRSPDRPSARCALLNRV